MTGLSRRVGAVGAWGLHPALEQGRVCILGKDHRTLINNNRQAGRRRGRGGQRQGGGNSNAGNGNRIDNRARGNAAQLLEKYKALASDAQRQGDRVNTEYYLQFADHYFRVLAETRSRFEEQNPNQNQRRGREDAFDDEEEGFDEEHAEVGANDAESDPRRQQQARDDRPGRDERGNREFREPRANREPRDDRASREPREDRGNREPRDDRSTRVNGNTATNTSHAQAANDGDTLGNGAEPVSDTPVNREPPRRGRPRREVRAVEAPVAETFDAALLPPSLSIGIADAVDAVESPAKPRRPRRRPAAEAADAAE